MTPPRSAHAVVVRRDETRSRGVAIRAGAVFAGLAAGLLIAEAGLRIGDRAGWITFWRDARTARTASIWIKDANPDLIYRHRPNYVKDGVRHTERHGILRPDDVSLERPRGVFRVVALGDSIGAALKLPYDERVFTIVERTLSGRREGPVEVLNFCVNGYSTIQEAALLEELAGGFEPNLLALQFCVNDFYPTEYPTRWFMDGPPSYLAAMVGHQLNRRLLRGYPPASSWERLYRTDRDGWRQVAEGFARIARVCRVKRIPALLIIFPAISHGGWLEGDARGRHARITALGEATGFEVLDLLPVYEAHPIEAMRFEPWDTYHPNADGHRVAAAAIVSRIAALAPDARDARSR